MRHYSLKKNRWYYCDPVRHGAACGLQNVRDWREDEWEPDREIEEWDFVEADRYEPSDIVFVGTGRTKTKVLTPEEQALDQLWIAIGSPAIQQRVERLLEAEADMLPYRNEERARYLARRREEIERERRKAERAERRDDAFTAERLARWREAHPELAKRYQESTTAREVRYMQQEWAEQTRRRLEREEELRRHRLTNELVGALAPSRTWWFVYELTGTFKPDHPIFDQWRRSAA